MKSPEDMFEKDGQKFGGSTEGQKDNHANAEGSDHSFSFPVFSSGDFVRGFVPPDYVLDGVFQRGFVYSLTGKTGSGKTTVALLFIAHVALGCMFAGRDVHRGRVLMLVGENADDVRMRWIGLGVEMGFDPDKMDVHFIPAIFPIAGQLAELKRLAEKLGGFVLVVVDTSAAYFQGDDENDNKQAGDHARDNIRALASLPGRPCVIANCHPTKRANDDDLVPRGGGAFIAEMDGNLTCTNKDNVAEVHWLAKFRGPDFEPMMFELITVRCDALRDSRGRHVPAVIARPLSDIEQAQKADAADKDLRGLMAVMDKHPGASIAMLAKEARWISSEGKPYKSKVSRLLGQLHKDKLAHKALEHWTLTPAGEKAVRAASK